METLFVYGTLRDPSIQQQLIGRAVSSRPAVLHHYRVRDDLLPPYPVAVPDVESSINGWLLHVSEAELETLDVYEGESYIRVRVELATGIAAWVYCASPLLLDNADTG